jgi:hypothetical protein
MEKDPEIIELLEWLRDRLADSFAVSDHWEADPCAIGLSSPEDASQLVYISNSGTPSESYAVELESAPAPDSDLPYRTVGRFDLVSRQELLGILTAHLKILN